MGRGQGKRREQRATKEEQGTEGGQPPAPPGAKSRAGGPPTTEPRTAGGRGTAPQRQQTGRRAQARPGAGRPNDTHRPPRAARPRRPPGRRSGEKGRGPEARPPARRRYSASALATRPPWTGRQSAAGRRRMLGAGISAASSAQLCCCARAAGYCARVRTRGLRCRSRPWALLRPSGAQRPACRAEPRRRTRAQPAPAARKGYRAAERRSAATDARGRG